MEAPRDVRELALACSKQMAATQYFSHTTAAQLLGMRLPSGFRENTLHVTSLVPMRAPRVSGVVGHQTSTPMGLWSVGGLQVSSPAETWARLGGSLSLDELIVMGDGLVCRSRPQSTIDELFELTRRRGLLGVRRLRRALDEVRTRTDSARETELRLLITRAGFPEPEINGAVFNRYGALVGHGDLVFRRYRTIAEYDGGQHRSDDRQFSIDIRRLDDLMEEKWRVIRVDKHMLRMRASVLGKVENALRDNGWDGVRTPA